jgi:hypothetical protein
MICPHAQERKLTDAAHALSRTRLPLSKIGARMS